MSGPNPMLAALWQKGLPVVRERLAELDAAAAAAQAGMLSSLARESAAATAHKLSGSLGMFGFPLGTDAARAIEQMLEAPVPVDAPTFTRLTKELRAALDI